MKYHAEFEADHYYHVYNRSNNKEPLFLSDDNRAYFFRLYQKYLAGVFNIFAFCLLPNHFHFLVQVKSREQFRLFLQRRTGSVLTSVLEKEKDKVDLDELDISSIIEHQFQRFFIAYAKAFNKQHERSGNLFHRNVKRVKVVDESHLLYLLYYIHANPQKHYACEDWRSYYWSSYQTYLSNQSTHLSRKIVLYEWFQGKDHFVDFHDSMPDLTAVEPLLLEEE